MNTNLDLEKIRADAKTNWLKEQQHESSALEKIEHSVPYWLIIIAVVMFVLSAAHTINTFSQIISGVVVLIAPLGVEFSILYCSFRRKQLQMEQKSVPGYLNVFEWLIIAATIFANGTGALLVVTSNQQIAGMSFEAIRLGFVMLPASVQIGLIISLLFAILVPFSAHIAGDGLSELVFELRHKDSKTDDAWALVERERLYRAVFQELVNSGMPEGRAQNKANSRVNRWLNQKSQPDTTQRDQTATIETYIDIDQARMILEQNREWLRKTERDLAGELGCSRHTARKLILEFSQHNGHVPNGEQ